ncbi:MAG: MATE family efflux transporter [Clostridia bacterium]|nr:MATE family efflux transporter [Clostridia bacterium]
MKEKTLISDFTHGNIPKQLVIFATPLFLSSLLQVVYNMVDMIVVGNVLGDVGLSAVAVGGDITNFLMFLAMGFCNAGQVIISQYIGAGKQDKVGKFIATMTSSLAISVIIMSTVCIVFQDSLLKLMNTPPEAYSEARAYSVICVSGIIFIYGYNIIGAILRGMGDSRHPFIFIAIAALLNIVLDILFVAVIPMGAAGAAWATIISQFVSCLSGVIFLYKKRKNLGYTIKFKYFLHIDKAMLSDLVKLGIPMAIKSASIMFSRLFVNSWINSYGVAVSAFSGIANKINSISNLISNSLNTAGASMVGQNIGAGKFKRVPKISMTIAAITLSIATVLSLTICIFPEYIFSIFTKDTTVLTVAMEYLPVAVFIFFGSACRAPANAILNGSGNYRINFATAIFDGFIMRIGLSLLFGITMDMKYVGFWLGDALAGFTPPVIGIIFYMSGAWKKKQIK